MHDHVAAVFLAGLALFALAEPGLAVGGILGLSAVTAGSGAFLGAYAGIGAGERAGGSHTELEQTSLEPREILVVACRHEPTGGLESIMRCHGGRLHAPS